MIQNFKIKKFSDISNKLQASTKKFIFEHQKAEAEAKHQRNQEETATVYEDFVKSFDDDDRSNNSSNDSLTREANFNEATLTVEDFSKRHFFDTLLDSIERKDRDSSEPDSLDSIPSALSRK